MSKDQDTQAQDSIIKMLQENYQKIILVGLILLVGMALIAKPSTPQKDEAKNDEAEVVMEDGSVQKKPEAGETYTVKGGETLWMIAEKNYDSGYAWVDIAKANKLADPNAIEVGQVLTMPTVIVKKTTTGEVAAVNPTGAQPQTGKVTITSDTYTVVTGDTLWSVAVRAYGDGYAWTKIAKANNLKNPDVIHKGNVLKLPR